MTPTPNPTAERRGCSNPKCPLSRAHSGPCAPEGWAPAPTAEQVIGVAMQLAAISLGHTVSGSPKAGDLARYILRRGNTVISLSEGAPSEEQVERAAKAYLNGGIYTLESDGEHHARMRAALTAAGVAPQEPQALDPEKVAEVLRVHYPKYQRCGGCAATWHSERTFRDHQADVVCVAYTEGKLQ